MRVTVRLNEQIVGGAQMLMRFLSPVGTVGYVPKGPLIIGDDPELARLVIDELHRVARKHHVQYLIVQPPDNDTVFARELPGWGFQLSPVEIAPTATTQIDLTPDIDQISARMNRKTRGQIRRALSKGLTRRGGTERDLSTFYRLLLATSQRQGFSPFSQDYYSDMWRLLHPRGFIKLFLVEYEGETISAQLVIAFGDTVWGKAKGWSGDYAKFGPAYLTDWTIIEWAKANGYRYYDMEGIGRDIARGILEENLRPSEVKHGSSFYKLRFGGQVVLFPEAYGFAYNPLLRWGCEAILPRVQNWPVVEKLANRLRTA